MLVGLAKRWLSRAITLNASAASYPIARLQQAEVSSSLSKRDEFFWGETMSLAICRMRTGEMSRPP